MKGLILNNLYSVEKSIKSSIFLAIAVVVGLILTDNSAILRGAIFLPFVLISVHAFEVLKHDALSGWNKFEITLPVTRRKIIGSKYLTFLLLFVASIIVVFVPFLIAHLFAFVTIDVIFFNYLLRGMGMLLCAAALVYPLTYKFGTEKSDTITMSSLGFSFGVFFSVFILLQMLLEETERFDQIFSMTFLAVTIVLFMISFIVSDMIYQKKEF